MTHLELDDFLNKHFLNTTKSARLQSLNKYLKLIKEAQQRKQIAEKESQLNKQVSFHLMTYTNVDEQKRLTKIAICTFSFIVLALVVFSLLDFKIICNAVKSRRIKNKNSAQFILSN